MNTEFQMTVKHLNTCSMSSLYSVQFLHLLPPPPVLFCLCLLVENTGFLGIKTKHSKIKYNKIKENYYIEVGHVMLEFL